MRIQTNTAANNAYRNLSATGASLEKQIQKLSSGFRINRASDDAAGLAIANKLRSDSRALSQASRNASQASSMLNIADGAVGTIASMLDRMKELASQAASSNVGTERGKLQDEWNSLTDEITRVVNSTKYQGTAVLKDLTASAAVPASPAVNAATGNFVAGADVSITAATGTGQGLAAGTYTLEHTTTGTVSLMFGGSAIASATVVDGDTTINFASANISLTVGALTADPTGGSSIDGASFDVTTAYQPAVAATPATTGATFLVGASGDYAGNDTVTVALGSLATAYTSLVNTTAISSLSDAQTALTNIDAAIDSTNTFIGKLGAAQSRIEFAQQNLASILQNTQAAESTIRDADMAQEMTSFTKQQILQQAGTAMLAQANQSSQGVLSLLRG